MTLHNRNALEVAAEMPEGSARLVYCDGPYGLDFGEWDRAKGSALVEWYAPFFDAFDRVAMPSSSLVVWGRSESWAWLHTDLTARGWRFCGSVVWDKGVGQTMRADPDTLRSWPQTHEVCGIYQRDELQAPTCAATTVAYAAGASDRNWIRVWLGEQWKAAGLRRAQADEAIGGGCMASRHYFPPDQWALPTWEAYQQLAAYAAEHGRKPDGLPWLVHPDAPGLGATYEHLRAEYEHLRAEYEHLRAEYERLRAPFDLGSIVGSVWRETPPTLGAGRHGHPCEKPPALTRRLIDVLTKPGELIFEPFGVSSPVARCCEAMPRDLARRWVSCELDAKHVDRTRAMLARTQGALL